MRCDFSSVIKVIIKYTKLSQDKIIEGIFTDDNIQTIFNSTVISRWISGEKVLSSTITKLYLEEYDKYKTIV